MYFSDIARTTHRSEERIITIPWEVLNSDRDTQFTTAEKSLGDPLTQSSQFLSACALTPLQEQHIH